MIVYLPAEEMILGLHDAIIEISGGRKGVLKPTAINAAIHRPKTYLSYDDNCDIHTVCAVLLDSIARNHAFADGNKRTGLMTVLLTYELNDIALTRDADHTTDFEELVLWVVNDKPEITEISKRLEFLIEKYKSKRISRVVERIKSSLKPFVKSE